MKKIPSYFENFAFKAFKFDDRATPLEYWCVMPVVWLLILAMIPGDARTFWNFLLAREIPPLNPFYYESFMLFVVTFVPRLALTVRRLHDSGKRAKWAMLPVVCVFSGLYLVIALLAAMASMGASGGAMGQSFSILAIFIAIVMGSAESAWSAIFASAAVLNALGWDAIIAVLAEMTAPAKQINLQQTVSAARNGMQGDPALILLVVGTIAMPFVAAMLHLFFMLSPSKPDHLLGSGAPMTFASLRKKGGTSDNPFAGYKYLYAKTAEQDAARKAHAKQEIRSLYKQRVLGQN